MGSDLRPACANTRETPPEITDLRGVQRAEIDLHSQELGMRRMSDTPHLSDIKGRAPGVKRRDGSGIPVHTSTSRRWRASIFFFRSARSSFAPEPVSLNTPTTS